MPVTDPSAELIREAELNHRLLLDHSGRTFLPITGSRWGELIMPAPDETSQPVAAGLRLVLFASFEFGYLALEAVKAYARRFPGRVQLVGLVTDDPVNQTARIGLKKRIWKYVDHDEIIAIETAIVESALREGVPAYTGEIKVDGFRNLLEAWKPDAIMSCVFGQVIELMDHRTAELRYLQLSSFGSCAWPWRRSGARRGPGCTRRDQHGLDHSSGHRGRRRWARCGSLTFYQCAGS